MDNEKILKEIEMKKRSDRTVQKKAITWVIMFAVVIIVLYSVMSLFLGGFFVETVPAEEYRYIFEPNYSYDYNIMKDEAYLSILNSRPLISLKNAQTGVTISLEPEDYTENGTAVTVLTGLVKAIQMGDADTYNSYFSRSFHVAVGKSKAQKADDPSIYENYTDDDYYFLGREDGFTMQQVYDVMITLISETRDEVTDTATYVCELKYKIRRNNGTFRADMGSDVFREQTITILEDTASGEADIINVTTYSSNLPTEKVVAWKVAVVAAASLAILAADIVVCTKMLKKISVPVAVSDSENTEEETIEETNKEEEQ